MKSNANDNTTATGWSAHVVYQPPGDLKPAVRNARTHGEGQIVQIMGSIRQFGFTNPVLVDADNRIVAGHGRVEAAVRLGMPMVPTISLDHLSDGELRVYALADNKLALNAGLDEEFLRIELGELTAMDLSFEIDLTGFSTPEIDARGQGHGRRGRHRRLRRPRAADARGHGTGRPVVVGIAQAHLR